ncbi:hypothetical protein ACFL7M_09540 [Thermodesulfobacteriota bacterium]
MNKTGRFTKAEQQLSQAIAIASDCGPCYMLRGDARSRLRQVRRAFTDYQTACKYGIKKACTRIVELKKKIQQMRQQPPSGSKERRQPPY